MSRKTDALLQTQFDEITNETIRGANDEARVGDAYSDLKDSSQLLHETISFTSSLSFDTNKWFGTYSMTGTISFVFSGTGDTGKTVEGVIVGDSVSGLTFSSDFVVLTNEFDNTVNNHLKFKYQDSGEIWTEIMTEGNFASPGGTVTINNPINNGLLTSDGGTNANTEQGLTYDSSTNILGLSGSIQFDTSFTASVAEGEIAWNSDEGSLDIGLNGGNVALQVGQEQHFYVRNNSGETINSGDFVMLTGTIGNSGRITAARAVSDGSIDHKFFLGVAAYDIPNGNDGYVISFGKIRMLDTTGSSVGEVWNEGDLLYANPGFTASLTNVLPTPPYPSVIVAVVVTGHASAGTLLIRIISHPSLRDLMDIFPFDPNVLDDRSNLLWNSTGQYFEAATFSTQIEAFTSSLSFDQSYWYDSYTMSSTLSFTQSGNTPINNNAVSGILVGDGSSTISFSQDFIILKNDFSSTLDVKNYYIFIYQPDGTIWTTVSLVV